ncbi:MAG: SUMF1/EgtB/PvdO family nonheme iron enzyme [Odoribacter splanchnicus]
MKIRKLQYWSMLLLSVLIMGACSDGELEGDLYPVSPDYGNGGGNNSRAIDGLMESMVRIPGGTFLMGSELSKADDDESPAHMVTLDAFYISRYEVTQQLWTEIMGNNPSAVKRPAQSYYNYELDYPVTNVSYNDCLEFIRKLNEKTGKQFALPSEAQWELAARGKYSSDDCGYMASSSSYYYADNSGSTLHEVGIYSYYSNYSNSFGLYHMSGNVYEWVADWYGAYATQKQQNPTGASTGTYRVFRGGSCASSEDECRVTYRASNLPSAKGDDLGFRLVMNGLMDLQVSPSKLDFTRNGGQKTLTVTTADNWSYSSSASWCRVTQSGDELTVNVESNNGKIRTAKITIIAGEDEIEIPVSQAGETFELLYNGTAIDTLKATHLGGKATLTVQNSSSGRWTVSSEDYGWCHVTQSGSFVEVVIDEYSEYYGRETYILLQTSGGTKMTDTVWVVQNRKIDLLLIMDGDPVKYLSAREKPAYADIKVQTNAGAWTAVSNDPDWCRLTESYNGFRIDIDALPDGTKERETFVAVDAEGISDTIYVKQKRRPVVGEVYDKDGVKGVVYEVSDDGRSGKIVSLRETSKAWSLRYSSSNGWVGATSETDGETNMQQIRNTGYSIGYWPAFQWCYDYDNDYQWYLPAFSELSEMFVAIRAFGTSKFDQILTYNGGDEFSSASSYWSSTEDNYNRAYIMDRGGSYNFAYKYNNYRVRAICKVTFD